MLSADGIELVQILYQAALGSVEKARRHLNRGEMELYDYMQRRLHCKTPVRAPAEHPRPFVEPETEQAPHGRLVAVSY